MTLSIITVNYNDKVGLERTIRSISQQTSLDYEHIIIDGNSTDGSKDVIEKHQDNFSYSVSEPDNGIYHAMNKGIHKAQGAYIIFMNSGDMFYSNDSIEVFHKNVGKEDFIYFDVQLVKNDSTTIFKTDEALSFSMLRERMPFHQATFIKKELFEKYGGYDEDLKIVSDWKFFIVAIVKHNASYKYVNHIMSTHYQDGISADPKNATIIKKERETVLKEHFKFLLEEYEQVDRLKEKLQLLRNSRKMKWLIKLGWINDF